MRKTHLAIAIADRAIRNGFGAFFSTAATLIDDLSAAMRVGQLAEALQVYTHPAVLVADEVGYLTYGTDAATMLFQVVNERHRRHRSMIFTTNKALKAWAACSMTKISAKRLSIAASSVGGSFDSTDRQSERST